MGMQGKSVEVQEESLPIQWWKAQEELAFTVVFGVTVLCILLSSKLSPQMQGFSERTDIFAE